MNDDVALHQKNLSAWKTGLETVKSILSYTLLVVLLALACFLLYVGISSKLYALKGPSFKPMFSLYTIISPSMEPNLRVNDTIVDKRVSKIEEIKVGDIITFISTSDTSAGLVVTHRVLDIVTENGVKKLRTKGDNNNSPDSNLVEEKDVLGRVILKIPQLGKIQFFLSRQNGWLLLIILPALALLGKFVVKLIRLLLVTDKVEKSVAKIEDRKKDRTRDGFYK